MYHKILADGFFTFSFFAVLVAMIETEFIYDKEQNDKRDCQGYGQPQGINSCVELVLPEKP